MTDLANHSDYIWRTFAIMGMEYPIDLEEKLIDYLKFLFIPYSYCRYGPKGGEDRHFSLRIAFHNLEQMEDFRRIIKEYSEKYECEIVELGYDEPQYVKWAYVIGTMIFEKINEHITHFNRCPKEFVLLMLHGFFNDLGYVYTDEMKFYTYALRRVLDQWT